MTGERRYGGGFTYLSLLFFVATMSVGLAAVAVSWQTQRQREKEEELLFAGAAISDAIALYYSGSPGGVLEFPRRLTDLLQDPRYPGARHYLRRLYRDPMTGGTEWGTIAAPDGGILGVHSLSKGKPVKVAGPSGNGPDFGAASSYADWKFMHLPEAVPASAPAGAASAEPSNALPMVKSVDPSMLNQESH